MNSEKRPPSLPLAIGCSALLMIASVAIVFIGLVQLEGAGMGIGVGILLYGAMAAILVLLAVLIAGIAVFRALWARCKRNVESTGDSQTESGVPPITMINSSRRIVVTVFVSISVLGMFVSVGVLYEFLSNL